MSLNVFAVESELRVYLDYSLPVDIRKVITIPDLEVSYGLAATLVTLRPDGQISSYLARGWRFIDRQSVEFVLDEKARWSNGERITAQQVVESFASTKREFGHDLVSLYDAVVGIESTPDGKVKMSLKTGVSGEEFLKKLTEPMYGIVSHKDGKYNPTNTSGPFFLAGGKEKSILMRRNPHWVFFSEGVPTSIELRKPKGQIGAQTLLEDKWPNLVTGTSLRLTEQDAGQGQLKKWQRNLDRLFFIGYAGRGSVEKFKSILQFLRFRISTASLLGAFTGYSIADQIYPKGMPLFISELQIGRAPGTAPKEPVSVLFSSSRIPVELLVAIQRTLQKELQNTVVFNDVPLGKISDALTSKKHDLYLGSVGVDSVNLDGAMSYYFELEPPVIPSGTGNANFRQRLKEIRKRDPKARDADFRDLLKDAVSQGFILPLFHYSTMAFARENIDLSDVPISDEIVSFSKVKVLRDKAN